MVVKTSPPDSWSVGRVSRNSSEQEVGIISNPAANIKI
jgi:hypothetical protein